MTENNIPTCGRCKNPMKLREYSGHGDPTPFWVCSLGDTGCSIAALRSEVEALRKRNEELDNLYAESRAFSVEKLNAQIAAESRAQELETKLRAAEDAVVVLREHIEPKNLVLTMKLLAKLSVNQDGPTEERMAFKEQRCWEDTSYELLSNTAALAAQRKREIVREALEDAAERAIQTDYSIYSGPRQDAILRAAILNPTEPA